MQESRFSCCIILIRKHALIIEYICTSILISSNIYTLTLTTVYPAQKKTPSRPTTPFQNFQRKAALHVPSNQALLLFGGLLHGAIAETCGDFSNVLGMFDSDFSCQNFVFWFFLIGVVRKLKCGEMKMDRCVTVFSLSFHCIWGDFDTKKFIADSKRKGEVSINHFQ